MRILFLLGWLLIGCAGCITPETKNVQGIRSPMLNAFQAAQSPVSSPIAFPLSPQAQAYAFIGGVLIVMVIIILKSSQGKD